MGGWDTHADNFEKVSENCLDLHQRGLLYETLVVLATEFGHTPEFDKNSNGRDHQPQAFTAILGEGSLRLASLMEKQMIKEKKLLRKGEDTRL